MIKVDIIREHVLNMLKKELSLSLTYHNIDHTLDVTRQCMSIAKAEGIEDEQTLLELEIAALYHDTGFIHIYINHEEKGCELATAQLPAFGVTKKMIRNICSLIMATKVPQMPKTHLEEIICDADLDYLGRNDFFTVGEKLRRELMAYKMIKSNKEWEAKQWSFLQMHKYFTKSSQQQRTAIKLLNMKKLTDNKSEING